VHPVGFTVKNLSRCTVTWTSNSTAQFDTDHLWTPWSILTCI